LDCKALGLWPRSSAPIGRDEDIGATYRRERDLGVLAPRRLKVGGNAQSARLLERVEPEYPAEAREQRISGLVRLHVILGKDGTVKQIELVSGHPLLSRAAIDAVRQWRYRVTILNGEPLEIDTTIDIIFSHNNSPAPNS
jgi:TonB family protein